SNFHSTASLSKQTHRCNIPQAPLAQRKREEKGNKKPGRAGMDSSESSDDQCQPPMYVIESYYDVGYGGGKMKPTQIKETVRVKGDEYLFVAIESIIKSHKGMIDTAANHKLLVYLGATPSFRQNVELIGDSLGDSSLCFRKCKDVFGSKPKVFTILSPSLSESDSNDDGSTESDTDVSTNDNNTEAIPVTATSSHTVFTADNATGSTSNPSVSKPPIIGWSHRLSTGSNSTLVDLTNSPHGSQSALEELLGAPVAAAMSLENLVDKNNPKCIICLSYIAPVEACTCTVCKVVFHPLCFGHWVSTTGLKNASCPHCKADISEIKSSWQV
ncbi:hypothetical protein BDR26DRAFT_947658, partial [Obelidium mucronatum]